MQDGRFDRRLVAAVFLGGVAGALLRVALAEAAPHAPGEWPWATFAANMAGAVLLGLLVTRLQERLPPSDYARPFLGTGLCGALTTFATLQLELFDMLEEGLPGLAAGYAATTVAGGFLCVHLATAAARRTRRVR